MLRVQDRVFFVENEKCFLFSLSSQPLNRVIILLVIYYEKLVSNKFYCILTPHSEHSWSVPTATSLNVENCDRRPAAIDFFDQIDREEHPGQYFAQSDYF